MRSPTPTPAALTPTWVSVLYPRLGGTRGTVAGTATLSAGTAPGPLGCAAPPALADRHNTKLGWSRSPGPSSTARTARPLPDDPWLWH